MNVFYETGIRFPSTWRYTVEVCADRGYGIKMGEYEQLDLNIVRAEMDAVRTGTKQPEAHHAELLTIGNGIEKRDEAKPEWWMDNLIDHLAEINTECQGEFE